MSVDIVDKIEEALSQGLVDDISSLEKEYHVQLSQVIENLDNIIGLVSNREDSEEIFRKYIWPVFANYRYGDSLSELIEDDKITPFEIINMFIEINNIVGYEDPDSGYEEEGYEEEFLDFDVELNKMIRDTTKLFKKLQRLS